MQAGIGLEFWALIALGAAAAIFYGLYYLHRPPTLMRALVKTVFMAAWTAAFIFAGAHPVLIVALAGSALGDFLLGFDNRWILPLGILAFLIAQVAYFGAFFALWIFSGDNSPLWPRYVAMSAIIATAGAFLIWMGPKLRWMALGVVPYAIAITAMASAAMWLPWEGWPAMLGAILFVTSDFVLATELFRLPADAPARRVTAPVVWWTYAAAQALILVGINLVRMN